MKPIFKKAMALLLVMLMSIGVIAPAVAEGEDTIKLAVIAPLTGDFAQYGEAYRTAVELMVSQVNAEGGINGKQLAYDIFDDKNDAKESATLAGRIADDGSYIALLGPFASTCALATAQCEFAALPAYRAGGALAYAAAALYALMIADVLDVHLTMAHTAAAVGAFARVHLNAQQRYAREKPVYRAQRTHEAAERPVHERARCEYRDHYHELARKKYAQHRELIRVGRVREQSYRALKRTGGTDVFAERGHWEFLCGIA